MERWKKITYMVAAYKFLSEIRPLDPYLTAYLTGPNENVSLSEVSDTMEMIKSYSIMLATIIVLSVTDFLLYKPVLVAMSICTFLSYVLLTGSSTLIELRIATVGLGATYGGHMLSYSYLFAQMENRQQYQKSTGIVAAFWQLGVFTGDVLSQVIVGATGQSYVILPYLTDIAMLLALIWACLLPPVKRKPRIQESSSPNEKSGLLENDPESISEAQKSQNLGNHNGVLNNACNSLTSIPKQMWIDFKTSFTNIQVLKRSFWYIIAMSAHLQILMNINILYTYVVNKQGSNDVLSNGFVDSAVTLCGALGAYVIGKVRLDWSYCGDPFTSFFTTIMGLLMISCYFYDNLIFIYLSYILYGLISQAVMVVNMFEMVKHLKNQCYSLILGLNFFGTTILVTTMTFFLIQLDLFGITVPGRFLFFGGIYVTLGIVFLIISVYEINKRKIID